MSMMSVAQELLRLEEADHQAQWLERIDRAMSRVCCPDCGSADGMVSLSAEAVIAYLDEPHTYPWPEHRMYQYDGEGEKDRLFTPCTLCNGRGAPEGYSPISKPCARVWAQQFREWEEMGPPDEYTWDPNVGGYLSPLSPSRRLDDLPDLDDGRLS